GAWFCHTSRTSENPTTTVSMRPMAKPGPRPLSGSNGIETSSEWPPSYSDGSVGTGSVLELHPHDLGGDRRGVIPDHPQMFGMLGVLLIAGDVVEAGHHGVVEGDVAEAEVTPHPERPDRRHQVGQLP